jgi:myo-inositol-1(or 4)-monophosphatase
MCCDVVMPRPARHAASTPGSSGSPAGPGAGGGGAESLTALEAAQLPELAELVVGLAVGAGRLARRLRRDGFEVSSKSTPTDLVTEVDRLVEDWIGAQLATLRPGDGVLGEEGTGRTGSGTVRWLVDPIDGTVNFALGLAHYGVSVAVEAAGRMLAGCVHDPESGEVFHARLGGGAYLDRDDVEPARPARSDFGAAAERPSDQDDVRALGRRVARMSLRLGGPRAIELDRAVIGTGFSYDASQRARQGELIARLLPRVGDIRRFGAASLDLCAVGAGRLDGFFEAGLNEWDYAAGLLVAREAGCRSSGLHGRDAGSRLTAVAGADLAPSFFELLADLGADDLD